MDKRIQDFPAAEAFGDDDLLLVSQSGATKTVTGRLVKALAALGAKVFAERAETAAGQTEASAAEIEAAAARGEAAAGEIAGLILRADAVAGQMAQAVDDVQAAQAAAEEARAGAEAAAGSAAQEASELAAGQTAEALRGELAGLTERSESAANRAEEAARRAESLATGVTMADLQSLIQCGSAALAEGLPPGGILFVEEASG